MISENFLTMLDIAKRELAKEKTQKDFQIIVIEYANGEIENFLLELPNYLIGDKVLASVKAKDDYKVKRIVCMWHNARIDLPCYDLRFSLYTLSPENAFTEILLQGENSFIVKEIGVTLNENT